MSLATILAVVACAALFVVFAMLRPANKECSGDCTACVTGACPTEGGKS